MIKGSVLTNTPSNKNKQLKRIIMKNILILLTILIASTSCNLDMLSGIKGSGNPVSEDRNIDANFENLQVQQGITVFLSQGNNTNLQVEADDNIIDLLKTEVENNTLKIYFEKNVYRAKSRTVYLTVSNLSSIRTSSGASVKTEETFETYSMDLDASSGSSIKLIVNCDEISSDASSGANISISGNSQIITASASSGSSIYAGDLKSKNATATVSSGASIKVNTSTRLKARASSGGSINYSGDPAEIDKSSSSGGSVTRS
jgi:hypothetical protein